MTALHATAVVDPQRPSASRDCSYLCCNARVDALTLDDAVALLCERSEGGRAVHLCNAGTLALTARDRDFAACINRGDLNLPDGMPLVWIARRLGVKEARRIAGRDLMAATIDRGRALGLRHYLYGSTPTVIEHLGATIRSRWPGADVVGVESPPFRQLTPAEESELLGRVTSAAPDVVWVGLGTPKQDEFVDRFRDRLCTTLVAVGAAFDFHAGTLPSAPAWTHDRGLEWAYRLAREPRRLWRRYLVGNTVFLATLARRPPRLVEASPLRGVVVVAGPDGAGKTALARRLAEQTHGAGNEVRRAHWRPGVVLGRKGDGTPVTEPHAQPARGLVASLAKVGLSLVDVWLAVAGPWRRHRRRGLVIWERGWHDQLVDPVRYRLHPAAARMARLVAPLVPRADAVVLATGDAAAIHARKPELTAAEVGRQAERWARLAPQVAHRVVTIDTVTLDEPTAAQAVHDALVGPPSTGSAHSAQVRLTWRRVPLTPTRLDLRAAGRSGSTLPIYRPHRTRARAGFLAARALVRLGATPTVDPPPPPITTLLGDLVPRADGWVVMRSSAPGRFVVGASHRGHLAVVAKIGQTDDEALANECEVLARLAERRLPFVVPEVRWSGVRDSWQVLALHPLDIRPGRVTDEAVLGLCAALGVMQGGLTHGDLAPWNLGSVGDRLALVDWEAARTTVEPLYDLAHFVIQRGALLGTHSPVRAARLLTEPGSLGCRYLTAIGEDSVKAPVLVTAYLDAAPPPSNDARVERYRQVVLEAVT